MSSKTPYIIVILIMLAVLSGCATSRGTGAAAGGLAGAGIGAAVTGGGAAGIIVGGLLGAVVGSEVGRSLDERDRRHVYDSLEHSRSGHRSTWTNPDTGGRYAVTPRKAFTNNSGRVCREFVLTSDEYGNPVTGVACRQPDGRWAMAH